MSAYDAKPGDMCIVDINRPYTSPRPLLSSLDADGSWTNSVENGVVGFVICTMLRQNHMLDNGPYKLCLFSDDRIGWIHYCWLTVL